MLSVDNPADSLLQNAFDFYDVNDLTTINSLNEIEATRHREIVTKLVRKNPHESTKKISVHTQDGEKLIQVDRIQFTNSKVDAQNCEQILLKTVA